MSDFIENYIGLSPQHQSQILVSVITVLVIWIIQRTIIKFLVNRIEDPPVRYQWQKVIKYISVTIALILLIRIWFGAFTSLGTYFGLLSAGLAIAFKDLLVNMVGWMFILTRQPFKVGDRIEINNITGDVIDIRLFQFSVIEIGNWVDADQSTGRIINIPNGIIFSTPQANFTLGFEYIWHEIPVLVTFESDWKKAKKILTEIITEHSGDFSQNAAEQLRKASRKFLIYYKNLTPIVYTTVKDSGVLLTIRFICHVRQRRTLEEKIWEDILERFAKHDDIDFAYPTQRFFDNLKEGKPGTKPVN